MNKLFKYGITTPWYLLSSALLIVVFQILLKIIDFKTFRNLYQKLVNHKRNQTISHNLLDKYTFCINATSKLINSTCLQKALVLKFFLSGDVRYKIIIGVKHASTFNAHAWIECEDKIVFGDLKEDNYQPIWQWT